MADEKTGDKVEVGITVKKSDDFSEWFTQVLQKGEVIEYGPVSGCYIIRPVAMAVWEAIQAFFDAKIKKLGVKNTYFPLFIPESFLKKEAAHVEGFKAEVAWVTHGGESVLSERLAVRPTSETIMYDAFAKWIRSYRDLPLKINQWCNVVRWEFKHAVPFLRSREFLWQEGHTAHAKKKDADKEVRKILDHYKEVAEELLAVPVIQGQKSDKEKFAGALYTTSIETLLPNGKAVQCATSHCLGQNFSKAFNITFLDEKGQHALAWQNSWGISTRMIGIMIMYHSDDQGLVLPPRVAYHKVVIVPIMDEKNKNVVLPVAKNIASKLKKLNPILDDREGYTPGWKFNEWELKGVPVRLEIGPRDIEKNQVVLVRRDTREKTFVQIDNLLDQTHSLLQAIQRNLWERAQSFLTRSTSTVHNWTEFLDAVERKQLVLAPWCESAECEAEIKEKTQGIKSLNIPFIQPQEKPVQCANCGKPAHCWAYFAKSY